MHIWLTHSVYSFLQAGSLPAELLARATSQGYEGAALCDFDGVYGLVQAHTAYVRNAELDSQYRQFYGAEVLVDMGIWNEFYTPSGVAFDGGLELPVFLQNRISFIARSKYGYGQICQLLTYAHRNGKQVTPLNFSDLKIPWPQDVVAIIPCRGVSQLFSPNNQNDLYEKWKKYLMEFSERIQIPIYLAITPPAIATEKNSFDNHMRLSGEENWPLLLTPDVFFHDEKSFELQKGLTAIRMNEPLEQIQWAQFQNHGHGIPSAQYIEKFANKSVELNVALENNKEISSQINFDMRELRYQYPQEFLPPGFTPLQYLRHAVDEACKLKYGENIPVKILNSVEHEFKLILDLNFADYFLTVWDIVKFARSQDILCQGRGSAANSTVCFLLGITPVDPEEFDLLFERFISRERGEPPDIDVDFEHERREEVIQYIYNRYGRHRAAMVANVITFRRRGAVRAAGKAIGLKDTEISALFGGLPDRFNFGKPISEIILAAIEKCDEGKKTRLMPYFNSWCALAQSLLGLPRHLGMHSCGFVISNHPLNEICPIEPATMEARSVIQWNKDDIETLGMFKVDVLALGMLTAIRKTMTLLNNDNKKIKGTLQKFSLENIPQGDKQTYDMICNAQTVGTFQVESRAQMAMLPRLQPRNLYDLVIEVAIVRPGPITGGMVHPYIRRRQGIEPVKYPHIKLKEILKRTLGIPIFQEQVMRIAMAVGDFTPGEADNLRRAMGAWQLKGHLELFEEKLLRGMKNNGIADEFALQILKHIEGFSQYGFPESHAASFALIAYDSCYLKSHYPCYFLVGLLNSQPMGFYSVHSLLQNAKREKVFSKAPCVLFSQWDSEVINENWLQLGLRVISGLNKDSIDRFVAKRNQMQMASRSRKVEFKTLFTALRELKSNELISLIMSGAFTLYDENRRNILWYAISQPSSLRIDTEYREFLGKHEDLEAWDNHKDDLKTMRTSLGPHAVELIKKLGWPYAFAIEKINSSDSLSKLKDKTQVTVVGLATVRQMPPTAKGFMFITLEDEFGSMNLILKPPVHLKYRAPLLASDLLCVDAVIQKSGSQSNLIVSEIHSHAEVVGQLINLEFNSK